MSESGCWTGEVYRREDGEEKEDEPEDNLEVGGRRTVAGGSLECPAATLDRCQARAWDSDLCRCCGDLQLVTLPALSNF